MNEAEAIKGTKTDGHARKGFRRHQDPDGKVHAVAGHLGGTQTASKPGHMAEIGRKGGLSNSRERMAEIGRLGVAARKRKKSERKYINPLLDKPAI